jgi:hypothetical protein
MSRDGDVAQVPGAGIEGAPADGLSDVVETGT